MTHRDDYRQWPFLTQEEFELACAFFDQRYVRAELGPTRQIFKLRTRRTATTGNSFLEIIQLLKLSDDQDELSLALGSWGGMGDPLSGSEIEHDMANEDMDEQVLRSHENRGPGSNGTGLPTYSIYPHQPYVTFEVHLHEIYRMPTLWFALHDLPMGEPPFDLDSVYRYLVPDEYKSGLRAVGVTGGISAAPHPITDVPSFFIHPCRTKEAMENFDCPMAEYLMIWIGLIGGCVGLWVPRGMAEGATEGRENTIS